MMQRSDGGQQGVRSARLGRKRGGRERSFHLVRTVAGEHKERDAASSQSLGHRLGADSVEIGVENDGVPAIGVDELRRSRIPAR